jgi:hypothetical protein
VLKCQRCQFCQLGRFLWRDFGKVFRAGHFSGGKDNASSKPNCIPIRKSDFCARSARARVTVHFFRRAGAFGVCAADCGAGAGVIGNGLRGLIRLETSDFFTAASSVITGVIAAGLHPKSNSVDCLALLAFFVLAHGRLSTFTSYLTWFGSPGRVAPVLALALASWAQASVLIRSQ